MFLLAIGGLALLVVVWLPLYQSGKDVMAYYDTEKSVTEQEDKSL